MGPVRDIRVAFRRGGVVARDVMQRDRYCRSGYGGCDGGRHARDTRHLVDGFIRGGGGV